MTVVINEDILRRDTIRLLMQINAQIEEVVKQANEKGISPHEVRDSNNNWVLIPLLQAKAQSYNTLVMLQVKK